MRDQERLLDIKEAARFLNVSETSLRRWTNSGRLVCLRIGRRRERRFRQSDLLSFMEQDHQEHRANGSTTSHAAEVSGHTTIGDEAVAHGTHLCGMYASDEDRVRLAVDFLVGGLGVHEVCYVFGTDRSRTSILNRLEHHEPSLPMHIEQGRLIAIDFASSSTEHLELVRTEFTAAVRSGARSIRVVGDLAGFAARVGSRGVADFEAAYSTTIARRFPVVTLCQYDARYFAGVDLVNALRTHPDTFKYPQRVL